jgi:methionine-S-sulfoxide reductase
MINKAIFAAGCFWGVQYYFDQIPGITETFVGYTDGETKNPTYEEVCSHTTGHAEAVEIKFDSKIVDYETLVRHFFRIHDPTQLNRQGPDVGDQYRSAIFYFSKDQEDTASKVKKELQSTLNKPIVTQIKPASEFYPAEDYHQKFTEKTGRGACHVDYSPLGKSSSSGG